MNTKHAKSSCCHVRIRRFGHRRRQCCSCKRTWTIRPKKRGRHRIRMPSSIFNQVFMERFTLKQLIHRRHGMPLPNLRHRFRQALFRFLDHSNRLKLPCGPLTLLADGMRFNFRKRPWVLYLVAVKSCTGKTAVFIDPMLFPGAEGAFRWDQMLATIPEDIRTRIQALVVDNLNGMKRIAKQHHWVLQLCHFHMIKKLQIQWKRPRRMLKGGAIREKLYQLIRDALEIPEGTQLQSILARLKRFTDNNCIPQRLQSVLRDFLHSVTYYRSYRAYPELHLPATTNSMESMACLIRDLLRRTRCASSPKALLRWTTAFIRLHPYITCNGKIHQQI